MITFCPCGAALATDDAALAGPGVCPSCGRPRHDLAPAFELRAVELPVSESPSDPEEQTAERRSEPDEVVPQVAGEPPPPPPSPERGAPPAEKRPAPSWQLEERWYQFLLYPLRVAALVLVLAAAWATLTAFVWTSLP